MLEIARQPVHAPPVPWRAIGLLALLVVALAAGLVLIAGALPKVPEPFGLARNGQIAFARDGDIFIVDSISGDARVVIGDLDVDYGPVFSLQGTQLAFLRDGPGPGETLMVADADGSNVTHIAGPLVATANIAWSPDGSTIALESSVRGIPAITLAAADGSGARTLDLGMPAQAPIWRPTDGRQLLFRGSDPTNADLYIVEADGSDLRPLGLVGEGVMNGILDFYGAAWSPDGTQIAFHSEQNIRVPDGVTAARLHAASVSADGTVTADRMLQFDAEASCECWPRWSPDGRYLLFEHAVGGMIQPAVAAPDGQGASIVIGRAISDVGFNTEGTPDNRTGLGYEWAPDGSSILAITLADNSTWVLDPAGGEGTQADLGTDRTPTWQRLAP